MTDPFDVRGHFRMLCDELMRKHKETRMASIIADSLPPEMSAKVSAIASDDGSFRIIIDVPPISERGAI